MRFWEAVQQLRELPEWSWAIVRTDSIESDENPSGFAFNFDELVPVWFDELYNTSKHVHSKHDVSMDRRGPSYSDLDAIDWMLTRAGSNH